MWEQKTRDFLFFGNIFGKSDWKCREGGGGLGVSKSDKKWKKEGG